MSGSIFARTPRPLREDPPQATAREEKRIQEASARENNNPVMSGSIFARTPRPLREDPPPPPRARVSGALFARHILMT
uniref:WH2 domain-containing protein n=1 Tax=Globodera pallida TaxID=36090 RepID=A0A183BSU6_GLOPA